MTGADRGGTAVTSRYICMQCLPSLVLKADTQKAGRLHESLYSEGLSHVDLDNGPEDLVWTSVLGPDRVGSCRLPDGFFGLSNFQFPPRALGSMRI